MNNLVQFNNHSIELIQHNGQAFISGAQIGRVIELAQRDGVAKIYNRHREEFTDDMTTTVRCGKSTIRIFNREGAWLIGMFARTPKAAEFRKWVLNVLGAVADSQPVDKPVTVSEHTRSLPSGKKEIVLSEKARLEIGGIVKAVLQAEIRERENIRDVFREVIREEIADYALKKGIEPGEWNGTPTGDGLPFGSWAVSISHSLGAISCIFDQLKERNKKAVKLLSGD